MVNRKEEGTGKEDITITIKNLLLALLHNRHIIAELEGSSVMTITCTSCPKDKVLFPLLAG